MSLRRHAFLSESPPPAAHFRHLRQKAMTRASADAIRLHANQLCIMYERSATTCLHDFKLFDEHKNTWTGFKNPPVNTGLLPVSPMRRGLDLRVQSKFL